MESAETLTAESYASCAPIEILDRMQTSFATDSTASLSRLFLRVCVQHTDCLRISPSARNSPCARNADSGSLME
jgi:hypothetical protein